ncbi:hypothetical protein [Pontibacter pamirensis]|uniref:hypothetical protein n=1 Tax=Pontibacter pamirensis TaxID=2562824 RepID=UPI00192E616A|nr:hypothetical protein [Pontibacter pamirensis]
MQTVKTFLSLPFVEDASGNTVPQADSPITFVISGPGEIVATDNGDPTSFVPFPSHERETFNGLALVIVRAKAGEAGNIKIIAASPGLKDAQLVVNSQ